MCPRLHPAFTKEILMAAREKGEQKLDKVKQKAIENTVSVKVDVIVSVTSIVKEIADYAKKNKIDVIVVGSRGMSGFKKMLLGSTANGVITYAHCPVLVVK